MGVWGWVAKAAFGAVSFVSSSGATAFAQAGLNAFVKSKDVDLGKFSKLQDTEKELALGAMQSDDKRLGVQRDLVMSAMTHRIWWWAWGLFVFPVGGYHFMIFAVSAFDTLLNAPGCQVPTPEVVAAGIENLCDWYVKKVPREQEVWAHEIIQTIFIAQAGSGAAAGIAQAAMKILGRAK